jgi:hypothetical protein
MIVERELTGGLAIVEPQNLPSVFLDFTVL